MPLMASEFSKLIPLGSNAYRPTLQQQFHNTWQEYAMSYSLGVSTTKANITIPDLYHLTKLAKQDEKLAKILHKLRDHINVQISFFEKPECKCCDCEDDD